MYNVLREDERVDTLRYHPIVDHNYGIRLASINGHLDVVNLPLKN